MDLSIALNVVTTAAVVIGVVFGLFELRQALRARREHSAVEVVRSVESPEIRRAVAKVLELPIDADPQLIRSDPAVLDAARLVHWAGEMFGSVVFEGVVDLHTLDRMNGGWLRAAWSRLHRWVEADRVETRSVSIGEWWQWLYEMLEADPDRSKAAGAHVTYRGKLRD
jgi:hypothetical protein